ncbi:beta-glycosyltransferase/ family 2 [Synechococcus sp. Minos11]|nr:beta-glycosyltransferase/ family 2 [Synechococcus sp. Minos11]
MITLNEAHNLPRVLNNLLGWASEVFVLDSFSTDSTIDILIDYGVVIRQSAFHSFGSQWNLALSSFAYTQPWTLKLDPDEELTPELKYSLSLAYQEYACTPIAFERQLCFMGKPLPVKQHIIRSWRTGSVSFTNSLVNEQPIVHGPILKVSGNLLHHDSPTLEHWVSKQNLYTTAEAISYLQSTSLSYTPNLFGNNIERRMWFKRVFGSIPFRFFFLFLYLLFFQRSILAGAQGVSWAKLRVFVYFLRELKIQELKMTGLPYLQVSPLSGDPDPRVPLIP